jgi:short-subunit dehydrogenase
LEALQEVAKICETLGGADVRILPLDLNASSKDLQARVQEVGRVDVMINNGGASTRVLAKDSSTDVDEYITQVDYLAHVAITKALMKSPSPPSHIINMGSVASKLGIPVRTAYCGAKHALLGYMDALRVECLLDEKKTHILNACLGSVRTNVAQNAVVGVSDGKVDTLSQPDPNIENGLDPSFVAERILAVSEAGVLTECWLANRKEMTLFYLNQYCPRTAMRLLTRAMAKQYAVKKEKDE